MHPDFSQRILKTGGRNGGFTLMELSIVLVVIALLTGGIFAGTTLIRSMELKSIQAEANEFRTGIASFRDRYHAFPGDMANAEEIWGTVGSSAGSAGMTCPDDPGIGTETCDGDGNQQVAPTAVNMAGGSEDSESFRAWEQLQNAGMLTQQVTGAAGSGGGRHSEVGTNVPRSKFDKAAGWSMFYIPFINSVAAPCTSESPADYAAIILCRLDAGDENWFFGQALYRNILLLGAQHDSEYASNPILNPGDAKVIDEKFDDGLPAGGAIHAVGDFAETGSAAPDCTQLDDPQNSGTVTNIYYNIASEEKACALTFAIE